MPFSSTCQIEKSPPIAFIIFVFSSNFDREYLGHCFHSTMSWGLVAPNLSTHKAQSTTEVTPYVNSLLFPSRSFTTPKLWELHLSQQGNKSSLCGGKKEVTSLPSTITTEVHLSKALIERVKAGVVLSKRGQSRHGATHSCVDVFTV